MQHKEGCCEEGCEIQGGSQIMDGYKAKI